MAVLGKALIAAMLMSWGNEIETYCPHIEPTPLYHTKVRDVELIKDAGERYALIIAASMQARAKIRKSKNPCMYVARHLMTADTAFFQYRGWPNSWTILPWN